MLSPKNQQNKSNSPAKKAIGCLTFRVWQKSGIHEKMEMQDLQTTVLEAIRRFGGCAKVADSVVGGTNGMLTSTIERLILQVRLLKKKQI